MSICPDKIVISEYVDGQLPSPWKEKLEKHLHECPTCNATYEKYTKISTVLKHPCGGDEANFNYEASFAKLSAKVKAMKNRSLHEDTGSRQFWQRSIKLPVPMLAAAVLALLFLPAFTFFAATTQKRNMEQFAYPVFQASATMTRGTNAAQRQPDFNSGVSGFLRLYMPSQNQEGNFIVINMPANAFPFEQYSTIFQQVPPIETKEPNE